MWQGGDSSFTLARELGWLLLRPLAGCCYILESGVRAVLVLLLAVRSLRLQQHVPASRLLAPILRTALILLMLSLYCTTHMSGFVLLMMGHAWYAVMRSTAEGIFAHLGPNDVVSSKY